MMNPCSHNLILAYTVGLFLCLPARAAEVRFERTDYFVKANQPITLRLIFDADETTPGDQLPTGGFFSVGAAVLFPPGQAMTTESAIQLPDSLNNDGLGDPPLIEASTNRAGAAGAINVLTNSTPHTNPVFLTITLTNLADSGAYTLDSQLFLAPPFNNFVSGQGVRLDASISRFGSATVHVLQGDPDPFITSFTPQPDNKFKITFSDPFGVPALFRIERTAELGDQAIWEPIPNATILQTAPSQFEAVFTKVAEHGFFRIAALYGLP